MIRTIAKSLHNQSILINKKITTFPLSANFSSSILCSQSPSKFLHNKPALTLVNSYTRCFSNKSVKFAEAEESQESHEPQTEGKKKRQYDTQHKFIKVSPAKSEQNAQSFFMKCMELLPELVIPDLIHKIDLLKSKVAANGNLKEMDERWFLYSCERLFEKNNAGELMDYLVKVRPLDLRATLLNSTIFGFDSELDIKSKIDKFKTFSSNTSPDSLYNSEESEHVNESFKIQAREQTESELLSKTSRMTFTKPSSRTIEALKSIKLPTEPENLEAMGVINDFAGLEGLSGLTGLGEAQPIMNDMDEMGNESEDFLNFMPEKHSESQAEMAVSQAINAASENFFQESRREHYLKRSLTQSLENIFQYQTQGKEEVVYITQRGFNKKEIAKTNWVYLYGLPYEITDEADMKQTIAKHFFLPVGKIKNIKLFSYKNYLDITETDKKVTVIPNLDQVFDPISTFNESFGFDGIDYKSEVFEMNPLSQEAEPDTRISTVPSKEKDKAQSKLRVTKRILSSIKAKDNLRLDKSYALIELEDAETKEKALAQDLRIFGMYIEGKLCMIDDADYKLSINCYNVHWGSTLKNFMTFVNQVFEENNLLDLQVEIPEQFENKILTKFYVILRFNSLFNTLRAMQALEGATFEKRTLKIHHLYGSLKRSRGEYSESIDIDTMSVKTAKVNDTKVKEVRRISLISKDDEIHEIQDPLAKLEKELQTFTTGIQEVEHDDGYKICKIQEPEEEKWYQSNDTDSGEEDEKKSVQNVEGVFCAKGYRF